MKTIDDIPVAKFNVCDCVWVKFNKKWTDGIVQTVIHRGFKIFYDVKIEGAKHFKRIEEKDVVKPTNKRWVVTCIDRGDSCDGKPRVLGMFKFFADAKKYVDRDIEQYGIDGHGDCDFDEMSCDTCDWNIEEIEIEP